MSKQDLAIIALGAATFVLLLLLLIVRALGQRDLARAELRMQEELEAKQEAINQCMEAIADINDDHAKFKRANWEDLLGIFEKELKSRQQAAANATQALADQELELRTLREEAGR